MAQRSASLLRSMAQRIWHGKTNTSRVKNSIHSLGRVGHIEDIAVAKNQQGKKLGLHIIHALDHIGSQVGCYKVGLTIYFFLHPSFHFPPIYQDQQGKRMKAKRRLTANWGTKQTILDCSEANEGFYVKCGYKRAGLEMAHYYELKHA